MLCRAADAGRKTATELQEQLQEAQQKLSDTTAEREALHVECDNLRTAVSCPTQSCIGQSERGSCKAALCAFLWISSEICKSLKGWFNMGVRCSMPMSCGCVLCCLKDCT